MVDIFVMLLQPGAGDDLQGIKRGILEVVDMVIVTKDDGDQSKFIQKAKHDYEQALHILRHEGRVPPVLTCSSLTKKGFLEIWSQIDSYFLDQQKSILMKRDRQGLHWMWQMVHDDLISHFRSVVQDSKIHELEQKVLSQEMTSPEAARKLLQLFRDHKC
jgi:LAO/AO transport system kinase